jgi:hypothetical protein
VHVLISNPLNSPLQLGEFLLQGTALAYGTTEEFRTSCGCPFYLVYILYPSSPPPGSMKSFTYEFPNFSHFARHPNNCIVSGWTWNLHDINIFSLSKNQSVIMVVHINANKVQVFVKILNGSRRNSSKIFGHLMDLDEINGN